MIFLTNSYSQRVCGSVLNIEDIQQADPARYNRIISLEKLISSSIARQTSIETKITIPVVVHIVYQNSAQNLSNSQINSQIEVLNEDFNRFNSDRTNTPEAFVSVAGNANIEFKLAKLDPNGNTTNGITRTLTTKTGFSNSLNDVKYTSTGGVDAWNTQRYLNIWVCNFTNTNLMGYAQFPEDFTTQPNTDGVVISYKYFGRYGTANSPFDKGRTTTHEVGIG